MQTNIVKAAVFTPMSLGRWGLPLCLWAPPGTVKTSGVREFCETYDLPYFVFCPGEQGEGGAGIIPVPDKSGVIKHPPPEWVLIFKPAGKPEGGVLVVDELTTAGPALQPPLLGMVLDARVGGTILHPRVRRIAMANPVEYAANGTELNPAQANRMGHIMWTPPSAAEHAAYMMRGMTEHEGAPEAKFSAIEEEARVLAAWRNGAWARAVGLETSYLLAQPDKKNNCPLANDPRASRAWESDRSWEFATRALASADVHGLSEVETDEFVSAFIGDAAYADFKAFIVDQDLPDAAKLLDGGVDKDGKKVTFKHDPVRIDRTYAVLNACVTLVTPANAPRREERAITLWGILTDLFSNSVSQDLVLLPAEQLVGAKLANNSTNEKLKAAYRPLGQSKAFTTMLKLSEYKTT